MADRTSNGSPIRILTIIDEYTRKCLSIHIERQIKAPEVLYKLSELFITQGVPDHIRSVNGSEFSAKLVRCWIDRLGIKTLFIEPGSPWENGYINHLMVNLGMNY